MHFADGTPVPRKNEVTYLGCQLNQYSNTTQELAKRISACMTILKRLDIFWRHSSCPVAFKITTLDAVVSAKLLYGLDSAQLSTAQQNKLEIFHLKGLRKILRMKTTYVDRSNTNRHIIDQANSKIHQQTEEG